jgi:predicted O-methyltransferase YrrM
MGFIDSEVNEYLRGLQPIDNQLLTEIYQYGLAQEIPIMDPISMRHVALLSQLAKPKVIIEIGAAIGFSAMWLALANPGAMVHTIERNPELVEIAQINLKRAGLDKRVILHMDEAVEILPQMPRAQFVFVDAAKRKYRDFYELALPLLDVGGLMVFDNVLFRGYIANAAETAARPMLRKLSEFNRFLAADKRVTTNFLTVGDGLAVAQKLEEL